MSQLLNNIRLRNKMLLIYFLCVFAPILLTNIIFYMNITNNVRDQRLQDINLAVEQIKNDFQLQVEDAVGLSSFLYSDYNINQILDRDFNQTEDYVEAYNTYVRPLLNNYNPLFSSIQGFTIYSDNNTLLHSGNVGILTNQVRQQEWYREGIEQAASQPIFLRTMTEDGRFLVFSLLRKMDYFSTSMYREKLVKIDFKMIDLNETFSNLNMPGSMYILNPRGEIEYTTDRSIDWQGSERVNYSSLPSSVIEFDKKFIGVSYLKGWRIVGTVDEDEIMSELWQFRYSIIWLAFIMTIIPTVIIRFMTRSINERIIRILKHMKRAKSQNFEMIEHGESRDEIGQLTVEFNSMISQIKALINDVYIADIQKKSMELERRKTQLNALQSQINPHFLFNALETIRMRSLMKKEHETARVIHSMAKSFRISLTWNRDLVTVREEMELVHCFLVIQQYRFEDKLIIQLDVDETTYDYTVPKMTLLPFVENACIHGIEPLKKGGTVNIQVAAEGEELLIRVWDNGVGMKADRVDQLYGYLQHDDIIGERIGIQNVIYRLKLIYGTDVRFELKSEPNKGTFIELRLPIRGQ